MRWQDTFLGALTFRHATFAALRERSDVFARGFLVLAIAALIAGLASAIPPALERFGPTMTREQVLQQAQSSFDQSYNGPAATRAQVEPYVTEIAGMVYDLIALPPQGGDLARPVAAALTYARGVLENPFRWEFVGWLLFAGLVFHMASRALGGRASMAQMLGLTALAAAPGAFRVIPSLISLVVTLTSAPLIGALGGLLGFALTLWSAAVYVKATAVAQGFSLGRTIGALALGCGFMLVAAIVVGFVVALAFAGVIAAVVAQAR